jgi:hypothetical protein
VRNQKLTLYLKHQPITYKENIMSILLQLRRDIEQAIAVFKQNRELSLERHGNITDIETILKSDDPVDIQMKLVSYVDHLSSGFISIWPFLEVNQFKAALKKVLNLSHYQENAILRTLLEEKKESVHSPIVQNLDSTILMRLEVLEKASETQETAIYRLQDEVSRLANENKFLTNTISILSEENKILLDKNKEISREKEQWKTACRETQIKYEQLIKENTKLKTKITEYTSVSSNASEKNKNNSIESSSPDAKITKKDSTFLYFSNSLKDKENRSRQPSIN